MAGISQLVFIHMTYIRKWATPSFNAILFFGIIEFGSIKWHYMNQLTNRIVICFSRLPRVAFISGRRQEYVFARVIAIMIT